MKLYLKVTDFAREFINPNYDLIFYAGEDEIEDLFFLDAWEDSLNITGATIYFIVKNKPSDLNSAALINKSYASSTFPNPQSGEGAITLLADWTKNLLGTYIYQLLIEFSGGIPIKIASEGMITFKRRIWSSPSGSTPYPLPPYEIDTDNM